MFKSCGVCGRIHNSNKMCPRYKKKYPRYNKKYPCYKTKRTNTDAVKFRNSPEWQAKRIQIKKRDNYLCQICLRKTFGGVYQYNYENLQVHHVVPLAKCLDLKLCDENLITVCPCHHSMCECGRIPITEIKKIIYEQEKRRRKEKIICMT